MKWQETNFTLATDWIKKKKKKSNSTQVPAALFKAADIWTVSISATVFVELEVLRLL